MRPLSFLNEAAPRPTKRGQERRGEDQDEVQVGVDEQGHGSAQGSTLHAVRPHDDREYFKKTVKRTIKTSRMIRTWRDQRSRRRPFPGRPIGAEGSGTSRIALTLRGRARYYDDGFGLMRKSWPP